MAPFLGSSLRRPTARLGPPGQRRPACSRPEIEGTAVLRFHSSGAPMAGAAIKRNVFGTHPLSLIAVWRLRVRWTGVRAASESSLWTLPGPGLHRPRCPASSLWARGCAGPLIVVGARVRLSRRCTLASRQYRPASYSKTVSEQVRDNELSWVTGSLSSPGHLMSFR